MAVVNNELKNTKNESYIGKKWFLKIAYKMIETDVSFLDDKITLSQGSGFAKVANKISTDIEYKNINSVIVKRKYSIPNVILASLAILAALITQVWAVLIVAALVFWIGSTAVTIIQHSDGAYEIPTEFKSEAEELQIKINAAIHR